MTQTLPSTAEAGPSIEVAAADGSWLGRRIGLVVACGGLSLAALGGGIALNAEAPTPVTITLYVAGATIMVSGALFHRYSMGREVDL